MVTKVNTTVIDSTNANVSFATTANNSSFLGGAPAASFALTSSIGFGGVQIFTSSGTFTVPAGISRIKATVIGGGGGSGSASGVAPDGGECLVFCSGVSGNLTVTVGAGGIGSGTNGTVGGDSSLIGTGANIIARGGQLASQGTVTVTTGTLLRASNGTEYVKLGQAIFGGIEKDDSSSAAATWSTTSSYYPGSGGKNYADVPVRTGGVSGVVMIEW